MKATRRIPLLRMSENVDLQLAVSDGDVPGLDSISKWVGATLSKRRPNGEIVIRVVEEAESRELNNRYRQENVPTNVLSFPAVIHEAVASELLGDLVICAPVVSREAEEQTKHLEAHWAHMVVHGTLHLLGYDHQTDDQAAEMEAIETQILSQLGYRDPYETV